MGWSLGSAWDDVVNGGAARTGAQAAQNAASAQQAQSQKQWDYEVAIQQQAVTTAAPSPEQLLNLSNQYANISNFYANQQVNMQRNMELLNSNMPALQQAGIQAYQLMTGKDAAMLKPLQAQQQLQRNQLENSLRDKLGSGYATSSAGMEALSSFDQKAQMETATAQQNALGMMLQTTLADNPNMVNLSNSIYNTGAGMSATALNSANQIKQTQIGALQGSMPKSGQGLVATAGSPWVGAGMQSQTYSGYGNMIGGWLAGAGMSAMTGVPNKGPDAEKGNQTNPGPFSTMNVGK